MSETTVLDRLADKFTVGDGCWEWTGSRDRYGYGRFSIQNRYWRAHRIVYELLVGPIPAKLDLDHLCRNHDCVRPSHLARRENLLRGRTLTARNAAVTECLQGHKYTEANTYTRPGGGRHCRICREAALKKFRSAAA